MPIDLSETYQAARQKIDRTIKSDVSPERLETLILSDMFHYAKRLCLSAAKGQTIDLPNLFCFLTAKYARQELSPAYDCNFDLWPQTVAMTFLHYAGNSARELIEAFLAAVGLVISKADINDIWPQISAVQKNSGFPTHRKTTRKEDAQPVYDYALNEWLTTIQLKLFKAFDLRQPLIFNRDCEALYLKFEFEYTSFFKSEFESKDTSRSPFKNGKTPKAGGEKPKPDKDFEITEGQVLYKGKDLGFPVGRTIEVFQKLLEKVGKIVPYTELDGLDTDSKKDASQPLRKEKGKIKTILKRNKMPFLITSKRNVGYCLTPHKTGTKKAQ